MEKRIASTLGYIGSVAAATLAAALMSGNALAEGPISDQQPFGWSARSELPPYCFANDCGLGPRVGHPKIAWAKFEALVEGARLATTQLWGR